MLIEYFIATLAALASGIFTWVLARRVQEQLVHFKDIIEERTAGQFSQLFVFVDITRYIYIYMGCIFFIPLVFAAISGELFVGLLLFGSMLLLPHFILKLMVKQRLKKFEAQLPDAMLSLAASLRSGASLSIALNNLVEESQDPLSQEFKIFIRERTLGVDLDTAITNMEKRLPLEDLYLCFSAFQISRDAGGNLADTLESLAETLRSKLETEGKIKSLTAQGKLQGLVMTSLPLLLIAVLMKVEPQSMGLMFNTRIGWLVLSLIVVMQILGFLSIKKITDIDV